MGESAPNSGRVLFLEENRETLEQEGALTVIIWRLGERCAVRGRRGWETRVRAVD